MRVGMIARVLILGGIPVVAACGRLGFEALAGDTDASTAGRDASTPRPADAGSSDAGASSDASVPDASRRDGQLTPDAGSAFDASSLDDAGDPDDGGAADATPDAGLVCPPPLGTSYCDELPALAADPVIDGLLEPCLDLEAITPLLWTSASPLPAGEASRYAAAWRPGGLYVYVEVDDATRLPATASDPSWKGDGIEVYVDDDGSYLASPAYDNPGTAQLVFVAPESDVTSAARSERYRDTALLPTAVTAGSFASVPRAGGYALELMVSAADLDLGAWTLQTNGRVGLDLGVNVSASADPAPPGEAVDGRRLGQYFLSVDDGGACAGAMCMPYMTVAAYCTPLLR